MNKLVHALRSFDECSIDRTCGKVSIHWVYPEDRKRNRKLDQASVDRLIAAGYLAWTLGDDEDPRYEYLRPTARGMTIVLRYRPNSWCQPTVYPNYTNWLSNARRIKDYVRIYGC